MNDGILNKDIPRRHYAGVNLNIEDNRRYFAIKGIINVYNLPVQNADQITSAYIYLQNGGSVNDKNVIMVGWEADKTQNKGCTNLLCPGFVQIDTSFPLSKPVVTQTSIYNGEQFEMGVEISNDPETNNWWVRLENKNLGYYPGILFSNLAYAKLGGWTGMTSTPRGIPSPPMGSGHFPDNNLLRSCYIRQMNFQTDTRKKLGPINYQYAVASTDNPNCFGVQCQGYNDDIQGYAMLFGGSGGNCGE
ncbi:unnamed protein product [Lupinus luteus]|uniref:Neprosin PEP catalytic domain-containing protein n=1 Tax=Lupinus luteus TaxID=3873 RepID=A0AAV1W2V1_LUPLU